MAQRTAYSGWRTRWLRDARCRESAQSAQAGRDRREWSGRQAAACDARRQCMHDARAHSGTSRGRLDSSAVLAWPGGRRVRARSARRRRVCRGGAARGRARRRRVVPCRRLAGVLLLRWRHAKGCVPWRHGACVRPIGWWRGIPGARAGARRGHARLARVLRGWRVAGRGTRRRGVAWVSRCSAVLWGRC